MCMCIHMGMCTHINKDYLDCDPAQKPGVLIYDHYMHVSVGN